MARHFTQAGYADPVRVAPHLIWAIPIAVGVFVFLLLATRVIRDTNQLVQQQLSQAESEFCQQLGLQSGAQQQACMDRIAELMRRQQQIRSIEF